MASGRRLIMLVVVLALVGAPAIALTAFCVGESCAQDDAVAAAVPFCPLPSELRGEIEAGYRQGRSPDVMAATAGTSLVTDVDGVPVAWPSTHSPRGQVPIVFWGTGVRPGALPDGTGLDQIAPTLSSILGFARPHPQVRAGLAVAGTASGNERPRLVVVIAWKGVGSNAGRSAPALQRALAARLSSGAGTLDGTTGAAPLDPVAALTTIGTGALPSQHGITAASVRNDHGVVRHAWDAGAPLPVVSTLAEDLDRRSAERSRIGLIARHGSDRGLIGGSWYPDHDRDDVRPAHDPVGAIRAMLAQGYGTDDTPDMIAVALDGSLAEMRRTTDAVVSAVDEVNVPTTFVVAGTGRAAGDAPEEPIADEVDAAIGAHVVSAIVPGGLFLDQSVMAANDITSDDVVRAMDAMMTAGGTPLFADAYPGFAISFSRYC